MNKTLLVVLLITFSVVSMAQEKTKQKEVGLVFNSLNSFGLTYKTGTEKSLWRFSTLIISSNNQEEVSDSSALKQSNAGFGLRFGKEYRKVIVENLEFRYGADLAFTYSHTKLDYNDKSVGDNDRINEQTIYAPGINLVLGLNYVFKDSFVLGAELLPYFTYRTGTSKGDYRNDYEISSDITGFSYGLNNTSAMISLAYRF